MSFTAATRRPQSAWRGLAGTVAGQMMRHIARVTHCADPMAMMRRLMSVLHANRGYALHRMLSTLFSLRCGRSRRAAGVLLLLLGGWHRLLADGLSEDQIKAAYLYNFAKFVEWPGEALPAGSDIVLCIVGSNVLDGALEALNGRNIGERALRVEHRNFSDHAPSGCHLLFIGISEQTRFMVTLKALGNAPVLTLSDIADFAEKGGGIGLRFRDNKVVFEVNLDAIRNARLHLPSQLLNIASHVYGR